MPDQMELGKNTAPPAEKAQGKTFGFAGSRVFFGRDGLRAGWSLLLFLLVVALLSVMVNGTISHFHLLPKPDKTQVHVMTPRLVGITDGLSLVVFLAAAGVMSRVERRPFRQYGFAWRAAAADLLAGLLWGVLFLSGLVGALLLTHHLSFDGTVLHGAVAARYACEWAASFLLVGLFEEFVFRGYLQFTLARGIAGMVRGLGVRAAPSQTLGFWSAAFVLSGLVFAGLHTSNGGETVAGIAAVAAAGLTLVFALWRTGSLWWAIGFHAAWDWAQSCLYGTADSGTPAVGHLLATHPMGSALLSGGSDGPEGSLLVLPTLALVCLVIHWTVPRHIRSDTPGDPAVVHQESPASQTS